MIWCWQGETNKELKSEGTYRNHLTQTPHFTEEGTGRLAVFTVGLPGLCSEARPCLPTAGPLLRQSSNGAQWLSHVPLSVTPCSLPGYPVHGLSQARILERVAISFSKEAIVHNHNPKLLTPSPLFSTISLPLRGESLTWALCIEFRNLDNYCSFTYFFFGWGLQLSTKGPGKQNRLKMTTWIWWKAERKQRHRHRHTHTQTHTHTVLLPLEPCTCYSSA